MSKDATPGPDGLSRNNYVAAIELLARVGASGGASPDLVRQIKCFIVDREGYELPEDTAPVPSELTPEEKRQWDAESVRTLKAVELARHELRHNAQVAHNKNIREGVEEAVAEWLVSIFKNRHPSGIPSFEDGTDVKLTLKAGAVAEGEHGEILYQVLVEYRTKGVI